MEEVHKKIKLTQWGSQILTSILTSEMMVTKNPQNVHRKYFWAILMTFIFDVKIDVNICEPHYVHFFFSKPPPQSRCLTIWHLTSFWQLDAFNLNHLSPHRAIFLGGVSLHLNHLIASHMGICYRQFGTLPIGIFLSNLDSRQLDTSLMTSYGHFWHMSTFGDSRAIWVLLPKYGALRKSKFSRWKSNQWSTRLGGFRWADKWATWWYHFLGGVTHLRGAGGHRKKKGIFQDICDSLKGTRNWPIWPRISP